MSSSFYQPIDHEIIIPGLKKPYVIMQFSDSHLCCRDDFSDEEEIKWAEDKNRYWLSQKKFFADLAGERCDASHEMSTGEAFEMMMRKAEEENPDLLVLTGDMLEIMHPAGEKVLRERLLKYAGKFVCVPGNHESDKLQGVWGDEPHIYDEIDFLVVSLNDTNKTVNDKTLEVLLEVTKQKKPVIVIAHIPVCTKSNYDEMSRFDEYFFISENSEDENARKFVKLLSDSDVFRLVLCGHLHGYSKSCIGGDTIQICSSQGMIGSYNRIILKGC